MAGKNKIERSIRLYWDDGGGVARDLSTSLIPGSIGPAGGKTGEEVDMTGVSDTIRKFLTGFSTSEVSARFLFDDTASTGSHTVLNATVGVVGTLTIEFGSSGSAPTTGDPKWSGEYVLIEAPVSQDAGRIVIDARWLPAAGAADPAWGVK
jgi:hypothetical protein